MIDMLRFPPDFLWGTATAAHQVEGQNTNNDWWAWEQEPGRIKDGTRSGLAADWWGGRFKEDFALARQMGQNAHRLSIEWSRIEPRPGQFDHMALDRYREMIGYLRDQDMAPMLTLHHFTNPLWLAKKGAWECEETPALFERFTHVVVEALGDLVDTWCTVNEPLVYAVYGYLMNLWPPGRSNFGALLRVVRNLLLGHVRSYAAIHDRQPEARVGVARHLRVFDPAAPHSVCDRAVTYLHRYLFDDLFSLCTLDGMLRPPLGAWSRLPGPARSLDYLGINYYSRDMVAFDFNQPGTLFSRRFAKPGAEFSMEGWGEVYPEGLQRLLAQWSRFGLPIYVTECGVPDNDDSMRPRFILTHLAAVYRAIATGVPVKGFYFWSLVDNFEWAEGWSARFGLIHLDPETQERRLKRSGSLYGEIIKAGGITAEMVERYAPEVDRCLLSPLFDSSSAL